MSSQTPALIGLDELEAYRGSPMYLFIGIDTAGSRVHDVFPTWSSALGLDVVLRGLDLPVDTDGVTWRRLVAAMRDTPDVHGAVITSHKQRIHHHTSALFNDAEPLVAVTHEVNSLDTRDGVRAFARDAQSLDIVLHDPRGHLAAGRPLVCIGSGGSSIALLLATRVDVAATVNEGHVVPAVARHGDLVIVGRSQRSLDEVHEVARRAGLGPGAVRLELAERPEGRVKILGDLPDDVLVINATGLGKSGPGSPLPDATAFPVRSAAWDFNYRGPLTFLEQARTAGIPAEDGWDYFLAGWSCALAAITGRDPATVLGILRDVTARG